MVVISQRLRRSLALVLVFEFLAFWFVFGLVLPPKPLGFGTLIVLLLLAQNGLKPAKNQKTTKTTKNPKPAA